LQLLVPTVKTITNGGTYKDWLFWENCRLKVGARPVVVVWREESDDLLSDAPADVQVERF